MRNLFFVSIFILFLVSCQRDEKIIDNSNISWQLLAVNNEDTPSLKLIEYPEGKVLNEDVFLANNGVQLSGKVSKLYYFMDVIYLLIPDSYKIECINSITFKRINTIDFSGTKKMPSGMCFANGTDSYICHENDSTVTLYDLKNMKIARSISVGINPTSIAVAGNQIYVANKKSNSVSIIDSRTNKVEASIPVSANPKFVGFLPDASEAVIISAGNGKSGNTDSKSPSIATFINVANRNITGTAEIGNAVTRSIDFDPISFEVSPKNFGLIASQKTYLRLDLKARTKIYNVDNWKAIQISYNFRRDEILAIREDGNSRLLIVLDKSTGKEIGRYSLAQNISAILAL